MEHLSKWDWALFLLCLLECNVTVIVCQWNDFSYVEERLIQFQYMSKSTASLHWFSGRRCLNFGEIDKKPKAIQWLLYTITNNCVHHCYIEYKDKTLILQIYHVDSCTFFFLEMVITQTLVHFKFHSPCEVEKYWCVYFTWEAKF